MRIKPSSLLLLIFILGACGKTKEKLPNNILAPEQMVGIMADVQLAEAAIANKNLWGDSAKKYAADCYDFVYQQHRVNKQIFESSLNYYVLHPKELDQIYTDVISELSQREAEAAK